MARVIVLVVVALSGSSVAIGQEAPPVDAAASVEKPGCVLHASPDCVYFGLTNIGVAFGDARKPDGYGNIGDSSNSEMFIEGGVMRNVSSRNAIGATWFVAFDNAEGSTGPGARYRRWLTARQSLEAGLSIPVASGYEGGTLFGMIRYSPAPWIGLTVRPERIRYNQFGCTARGCESMTGEKTRVLIGGDLGGAPGATAMAGYGIAAGVLLLLFALAY